MGFPATAMPFEEADDVLRMFVIYEKPADYPEHFVVRQWYILEGNPEPVKTDWVALGRTLDEVRAQVPRGLARIDRDPNDPPKIVETWT